MEYGNFLIDNDFTELDPRSYMPSPIHNELQYELNDISNGEINTPPQTFSYNKFEFQNEIPEKQNDLNDKTTKNSFCSTKVISNGKSDLTSDITNIFNQNDAFTEYKSILDNINENPKLKEIEENMKFKCKKRKREEITKPAKKKRGRKKNSEKESTKNEGEKVHNKLATDNIMKKIKGNFHNELIAFINGLLNMEKKEGLKILNYKNSINQLKKDNDLCLLNKTIKEVLSQEITSKYKNIGKEWNIKLIDSILNKTTIVEDYDLIKYVFNMEFRTWINIYTLKEDVNNLNINETWKEKIRQKLPNITDLFKKIKNENKENDENYLSYFIWHIYNYENCFLSKIGRKRIK